MKPTIESIITSIPDWQLPGISHEPLNGGLTNDTYKVTVNENHFVVRINGTQCRYLGLSRTQEADIIGQAYELGIAPCVFRFGNPDDILVTGYLPGGKVISEEAHTPQFIEKLGNLFRKIHSIKNTKRRNDPFSMIEKYIVSAEKLGISRPDGIDKHLDRMKEIERQYNHSEEQFCHNDIFIHNLIWEENELRAIDWELSGFGDVYFDLASIACSERYTEAEEIQLLTASFDECNDDMIHCLHEMRFVGLIREIAWAMLMQAIVENPVNHSMDFTEFRNYVMDQLNAGSLSA